MQEKIIEIDSTQYKLAFSKNKVNLYKMPPAKQILKIKTNESTDYTLNNTYFLLPTTEVIYCIFFNINNQGPGPNPSSLFSQIEVSLDSPNKSSIQIAEAIKDKIDSVLSGDFETSINSDELTITNKTIGKSLYDYQPRDANTGFTFAIKQYGRDGNSLVKSEFPENHSSQYGTFLYEILDADLEPFVEGSEVTGANLLVNGIFRESTKTVDSYNDVTISNEFEVGDKQYQQWLQL